MGEEKLRRERDRAKALAELADWTRPPSSDEASLVEEIGRLPTVFVERQPAEVLARGGMRPKECHANCQWLEDHDTNREHKAIKGWWKQPYGVYLLHSVVQLGQNYACVTPGSPPDVFEFAPDPEVVLIRGDNWSLHRRGQLLPKLVRSDPARTIKAYSLLVQQINAGMPLAEAEKIDWYELYAR